MASRHALSAVAALVGEPTRAAMLLALLDGRALPAGELAREARLSPAATSLHLGKLCRGGLLVVHQAGRHRYYRLASEDVGHALEALGVIATARPPARALAPAHEALRAARTCYDHLAGAFAITLVTALERARILRSATDRTYEVTPAGVAWFADVMRIDTLALARQRRPRRELARRCLDWTERRHHVAGSLGAAILDRALSQRWVARIDHTRALRVTLRGRDAVAKMAAEMR